MQDELTLFSAEGIAVASLLAGVAAAVLVACVAELRSGLGKGPSAAADVWIDWPPEA